MNLPTYFDDFLTDIRPTASQQERMKEAHAELRTRLESDGPLKLVTVGTFIQGSYRRHTGIKATSGYECDVDVVVVTNLPKTQFTALHTLDLFRPFLERHYKGRYEPQDRSWCIAIDNEVKLDLVPTAEPGDPVRQLIEARVLDAGVFPKPERSILTGLTKSVDRFILEAAETEATWDVGEPLWIPDRKRQNWDRTHPLYQIRWTAEKNKSCDGHFVNVVKALKWWKRHQAPNPKYPKGYPLEHLVGECCPDGIESVAEGVTVTLETIRLRYASEAARGITPVILDRALPENNVFHRVSGEEFAMFHRHATDAAEIARRALDEKETATSATLWLSLFGDPFPKPPAAIEVLGGFTPRRSPSQPTSKGRFA